MIITSTIKWISVDQMLPPEKADVLVLGKSMMYSHSGFRKGDAFFLSGSDATITGVTHWAPFPENQAFAGRKETV